MGFLNLSLEPLLVPLSIGLVIGYHVWLWCILKTQPLRTNIGFTAARRRKWAMTVMENDSKKGMLGVQSLRNRLMTAILTSTVAILINTALGALMNTSYIARSFLHGSIFGLRTDSIIILKYSIASLFLLVSFFCGSLGTGFLTEANFLINIPDSEQLENAHTMLELGSWLASMGNRALFAAVPMLLWMLGPVPMALSSILLVCFLYNHDFVLSTNDQSGLVADSFYQTQ